MNDVITPLTDVSSFVPQMHHSPVKFSTLFKKDLKLHFLLRIRKKSYYIIYIMSILITLLFILFAFVPTTTTSEVQHPANYSHTYDLTFTRTYFNHSGSYLYITSKNDDDSIFVSQKIFQARNSIVLPNINEVSNLLKNDSDNSFGLSINVDPSFTQTNQPNKISCTTIAPLLTVYSPYIFLNSLYEYLMGIFYPNTTVTLKRREYAYPPSQYIMSVQTLSILYFMMGHALITIDSATLYFSLNYKKSLFLLEINGVTNKVRFFVNLVTMILEHLPVDLISASLFCFVGTSTKGTNFLLFFISEYLFVISLFSIQIFFQPLLRSKGSSSAFYVLLLLYVEIFEFFEIYKSFIPVICYKVILCLFPPASFLSICDLMIQRKTDLGPMSFNSLDFTYHDVSASFALSSQLISTLIYVFFAILGNLCNSNCYGKPPIGWKNLFKMSAWRRMMNKSKRNMNFQSDEDKNVNSNELLDLESTSNYIEFDHLSKQFKSKNKKEIKALNSVSLKISQGEFIVALGSNGSGKTTLISSMIGAINVDEGSIFFKGEELKNDFDQLLYPYLGIVFQENVLFGSLTVKQHFEIFGGLYGLTDNQILNIMNNYLSFLKMNDLAGTLAGNLSGGSQRKLCVALALMKYPSLFILDEPTVGVDATSRQLIWKAINEFSRATVFATCHSVDESESISSRLLLLSHGQIAFVGTAAEMREKYNSCYFITIIDNNDVDIQKVVDCANEVPEANGKVKVHPDHPKTLMVPDNLYFSDILNHIDENKDNLGISKYTVHVENLEETMKKIIEDEESLIQN